MKSDGFLTPQAMTGARFAGRVPGSLLLTFHYNSDIFAPFAAGRDAVKCPWYREDYSPVSLKGTDKGWYILPGTGAPALMYDLENLRACGARRFVLFGKAGFLRRTDADLAMPRLSYIDEGTSAHYIGRKESVGLDSALYGEVKKAMEDLGCIVSEDPVWTTDAIYRETPGRIEYFKERGCLSVDMESSAFFSFCGRYGLEGASVLYKSDSFLRDKWVYHGADFNSAALTEGKIIEALLNAIRST